MGSDDESPPPFEPIRILYFPKAGRPSENPRSLDPRLSRGALRNPRDVPELVAKARAEKKAKKRQRRRKRRAANEAAVPTQEEAAAFVTQGHALFQEGRFDDARVIFERLVAHPGADVYPFTMLGTIYFALGNAGRALDLFELALAKAPNDVPSLVYRAEIRLEARDYRSAVTDLEHAVAHGLGDDPFVERARRLLAIAEEQVKRGER